MRIHKHDVDVFTTAQEVPRIGQAGTRAKKRHVETAQCLHETREIFIWPKARVKRLPSRRKDNNPIVVVLEAYEKGSSGAAALLTGSPLAGV
jgi:hypothetical protein